LTTNIKWSSREEPQKDRSRFCGEESEGTRSKAIEQSRRGEIEIEIEKQKHQQSYIVW
jgi:hypothetical protein